MKVGINLHLHTNDERVDKVSYSFIEALDKSKSLGIDIVALTCHDYFVDKEEYREEAQKRGMLFIPGIEKTLEGAHVIILNCDSDVEKLTSLVELREYKKSRPDIFVMAPHPHIPVSSLRGKLIEYGDIFDAVEMTWFYSKLINPNKKAAISAMKLNLPFIATSDAHRIENISAGFAIIDLEELSIPAVFTAIRNKQFKNVNNPKTLFRMIREALLSILQIR